MHVTLRSLCLLAIFSSIGTAQQPNFTRQQYANSGSLASVVQADFNEDGAPDFVFQGRGFDEASVTLSNGDGSYQPIAVHKAPTNGSNWATLPIAAGDFNGDGNADVLLSGHNAIGIWYGHGDGTFDSKFITMDIGDLTLGAVADFNRDGRQDAVVVAHNWSGHPPTVFALLNNGTGFTRSAAIHTMQVMTTGFPQAGDSVVQDLVDLVVGSFDGNSNADFAFRQFESTSNENSHGYSAESFYTDVYVYYGNGSGSFAQKKLHFDRRIRFAAEDMNNDGISDLAGTSEAIQNGNYTASAFVLLGRSDRAFTQRGNQIVADLSTYSPMLADFNGDRIDDIGLVYWAPSGENGVAVATGKADGTYAVTYKSALTTYPDDPLRDLSPALTGDYKVDRKPDMAIFEQHTGRLNMMANSTSGGAFPTCSRPAPFGIHLCAPANGSTVSSPVQFRIGAQAFTPLRGLAVWIDGSKKSEYFRNFADDPLTLSQGSHNITIFATKFDGGSQSKSAHFTVAGSSSCATPASSGAVVICNPTNGSTVNSPVQITARGGSAVTTLEAWVDGTKRAQANNAAGSAQLNTSVSLNAGSHKLTVVGKSSGVAADSKVITFAVQ